jgi:DNA modification methylase
MVDHHKLCSIADLRPAPYNPRKIAELAADGLRESIDRFGDISGIVWNQRTGRLVAGHQRVLQLQQLGAELVDGELRVMHQGEVRRFSVRVVDWSESEEKAANVSANNRHIAGEWTPDLGELLEDIKLTVGDDDFESLALKKLVKDVPVEPREVDQDEVPEPPSEPVTKPGDTWLLGRHRVICGDATNKSDVGSVVSGGSPSLMVTDPPYGVRYDPGWREGKDYGLGVRRTGAVENDNRADWSEAWWLFGGDVAYVWHAGIYAPIVATSLMSAGLELRSQIVWEKQHFVISRGAYHWMHEPCWYCVRKGRTANWIGDRKQITVWAIANANSFGGKKDDADTNHGTQKPIECMARPIRNHSGDVYDPFLGSGTTLIAAEQLDRTCYGIEIEPRYVDVTIERWENLTGGKAKRA